MLQSALVALKRVEFLVLGLKKMKKKKKLMMMMMKSVDLRWRGEKKKKVLE